MSQELVNSVNKLTDETSALLQEYVKGNTVLQNSASDAASSAAAAKASETNSVNQANIATQKAAESKQYRDETAAIATGGTATVDPAPGKIPLANSQGKISSGWLTALAFARTKADMDAMRASVNRQCAASGMIHAGKSYNAMESLGRPINEGLWSRVHGDSVNLAFLGHSGTAASGSSETNYPVFNIAGFPVSLRGLNNPDVDRCTLKFPQAPDGTDIYDSSGNCRGTGKPTLNLLTEVDPKYGDVAPNVNEAVARAFEGLVKNGDFRLGTQHWIPNGDNTLSIEGGWLKNTMATAWKRVYQLVVPFSEYVGSFEISFEAYYTGSNSDTGPNIVDLASGPTATPDYSGSEFRRIVLTKTPAKYTVRLVGTGLGNLFFNTSSGTSGNSVLVRNISVKPITEEVVTERVDLSGLEGYLEEITPAKPYIYPYGGINNQATSVDDIATTFDNVRPITYFANFTGDTTSRGRGWNLNDLTDAQLLTILQNPYHHVYVINGKLVQFRVRPRTIAGAGNGDWEQIDSVGNTSGYGSLKFLSSGVPLRVEARGARNESPDYTGDTAYQFRDAISVRNKYKHKGAFTVQEGVPWSVAYNGECYFYVLATVLRLNQGVYHPSLNPLGTHRLPHEVNNARVIWSGRSLPNASTRDMFAMTVGEARRRGFVCAAAFPDSSGWSYGGSLSENLSGRPDGRFYNAIYSDGQGGVIDRRLSAFLVTMGDYFKAMAKAENGTMLGMEKLVWTKVSEVSTAGATVSGSDPSLKFVSGNSSPRANYTQGELANKPYYVVNGDTKEVSQIGFGVALSSAGILHTHFPSSWTASNIYVVFGVETNLSVSGNFLQTDVIGHPANILQVGALKDGWLGSWIPIISGGTSQNYLVTRKALSNPTGALTSNFGGSWVSWSTVFSSGTNDFSASFTANQVIVQSYTAAAKVTKPSAVLPVYGHRNGLGSVTQLQDYRPNIGSLIAESLMGKVLTSATASIRYGTRKLISDYVWSDGLLYPTTGYLLEHHQITLSSPDNNSPAIKILPHAVSYNGQAKLGFIWNELKHNGTSWGDDGTMRVINNTGTYNNLNGQSCLYGYAELALPIGWVDNHARFGAQVPGVDL